MVLEGLLYSLTLDRAKLTFSMIFSGDRMWCISAETLFCAVLCVASHLTRCVSEAEWLVVVLNISFFSVVWFLFLLLDKATEGKRQRNALIGRLNFLRSGKQIDSEVDSVCIFSSAARKQINLSVKMSKSYTIPLISLVGWRIKLPTRCNLLLHMCWPW